VVEGSCVPGCSVGVRIGVPAVNGGGNGEHEVK